MTSDASESEPMSGQPREQRPVTVVGAGTLGRRIALMFAAGGSDVVIFNRSKENAQSAALFVEQHVGDAQRQLGTDPPSRGRTSTSDSLETSVAGAWLIVESVAEDIELKQDVIGMIDKLADHDAIIATNSSSHPSSEMLTSVARPERVLNTHFLMPPDLNQVELMSSGFTEPAIIDLLLLRLPRYGLSPFHVRQESVGFLFNRIWAAIKRETLMVIAEGVATPAEVDRIMCEVLGIPVGPARRMDETGLDVVLDIEEHYAACRDGLPKSPRRLLEEHVRRGDLGVKSGRGLYADYQPKG